MYMYDVWKHNQKIHKTMEMETELSPIKQLLDF